MQENFNAKIINEIIRQRQTSGKINPVDYLRNRFAMSKETAYRRIKNKISFSLEEAADIADDFNLSIDQLLNLKSNNHFPLNMNFNIEQEPVDIYADLLKSDIGTMEKLLAAANLKITAAINKIPFRLLPYPSLFKFDYCHYMYSAGKISLMTGYSDIEIPPYIMNLHEETAACFRKLSNMTCIIDGLIFSNIIKKIQYYYRMQFISAEDLQILQEELFKLLEKCQNMLYSGKNSAGSDCTFYYSFFNLETNVVFSEYDSNSFLQVWIYPESPIIIKNNRQVNDIHKKWIDSKTRNSMLITKTTDIYQIEMLRNIHQQISSLGTVVEHILL